MLQLKTGKKFWLVLSVLMLLAAAWFLVLNPLQLKTIAWHTFHSENVVYKGITIKVPDRWWVDKSDETSIVLFSDLGNGKEPMMVSLYKESFEFNRENIAKAINTSCTSPLTTDKVEIGGKEAIQVRCSPEKGGHTYLWFVTDTKTVLMSDASPTSSTGCFDELFSNIRWN